MRSFVVLLTVLPLIAASADSLHIAVDAQVPDLFAIYKDLHAHPEISQHEERTSARLAEELRKAGYAVTERVGRYADGRAAFGVVALLSNGAGRTILLRTDMDALPVEEKTSLPYASTVHTTGDAGQTVGVMHACGHDLHMASFLGTARVLAASKDRWHGTLMLIGQPSEERVSGARAMLADGLYARFGQPDFCIAQHDTPEIAAGQVGIVGGPILAGASSVDVTMRGVGGHGARPETTKDPVVMAAEFVLALQTIVSRQTAPQDPAVVTVGSIHGGTRPNIIPDEVKLQLSIRAFSEDVRRNILAAIERNRARRGVGRGRSGRSRPHCAGQPGGIRACYLQRSSDGRPATDRSERRVGQPECAGGQICNGQRGLWLVRPGRPADSLLHAVAGRRRPGQTGGQPAHWPPAAVTALQPVRAAAGARHSHGCFGDELRSPGTSGSVGPVE